MAVRRGPFCKENKINGTLFYGGEWDVFWRVAGVLHLRVACRGIAIYREKNKAHLLLRLKHRHFVAI
jgi:hypothetical protein